MVRRWRAEFNTAVAGKEVATATAAAERHCKQLLQLLQGLTGDEVEDEMLRSADVWQSLLLAARCCCCCCCWLPLAALPPPPLLPMLHTLWCCSRYRVSVIVCLHQWQPQQNHDHCLCSAPEKRLRCGGWWLHDRYCF